MGRDCDILILVLIIFTITTKGAFLSSQNLQSLTNQIIVTALSTLGAATITILNSGLTIMGLSTGQIQIVRGIVFIGVVFVSSFSYRSKLLPR